MPRDPRIRLIVNADDFGSSHSANRGIIRAHTEGILTSASLMVTGNAADDAVNQARRHRTLGVGIHLVLVDGKSVLKPSEIVGLVDQRFAFERSPVRAGLKYYFNQHYRQFLKQEINAQFAEFKMAGLPLDHVNGHLNFHLHPTVFGILKRHHDSWGIRNFRLTRDPLMTSLRLSFGRYFYRVSHALIFERLSADARLSLDRRGIRYTTAVFGLLQNGRISERYLLKLLDNLFPGTFELYAHPDEDQHSHELEALISPRVKEKIQERGIELIRYQDLWKPSEAPVTAAVA